MFPLGQLQVSKSFPWEEECREALNFNMVLSSKLTLCQQLFSLLLNLHLQKCIFKNISYQLFYDHHHILSIL